MLSDIRKKIKPLVEAAARPFVRLGFKPNQITILGVIIGIVAGLLFSLNEVRFAGVIILLGGFFDIIDGAVARLTDQVTDFGGLLDSVSDRITDAILFVGIIAGGIGGLFGLPSWFLPVFALIGSYLVSYTRARAEAAGSGKLDVGIAERAERLLILALGALLGLTAYAVLLIVVLTFITVSQRILESYKRFI